MEGFAIIAITGRILLAALCIEVIFRMAGRLSTAAKEVFRWAYIAGCGWLVAIFVWLGWQSGIAVNIPLETGLGVGGILLVSALLSAWLNYNKGVSKQNSSE